MSVIHSGRPRGKYATVDWTVAELEDKAVGVYTHGKAGTVHTLTGSGENIKFKATASFLDGDTWLVNGAAVAAKTVDGQGLHMGDIVSGSVVMAVLEGGVLWFQVRSYESQLAAVNAALSNKANTNAVYTMQQTDTALGVKANVNSPSLTGNPTAPTAAQTVKNAQLATTAYVQEGLLIKGLPTLNIPSDDADLAKSQGVYVVGSKVINVPSHYGILVVFLGTNGYTAQLYFGTVSSNLSVRSSPNGGNLWHSWVQLSAVATMQAETRQSIVDKDLEIIELRRMMTDLDLTVRGGDSSGQSAD